MKWIRVRTQKKCVQCGECCKQLPCDLAGGHNPCPALSKGADGKHQCGLIGIPGVREHLLVGYGCGATVIPAQFRKRRRP